MKKKMICALLAVALLASLSGCAGETVPTPSVAAVPAPTINPDAKANADQQIQEATTYMTPIENIPEITPEEEEAWKQEPAYGQTIRVGFNGDLCLGTFGIAQMKGFYAEEGLDTEIIRMTTQADALGTHSVDVSGGHIAMLLVPTVNGVNMTFTTGVHTGCKTLYALSDSDIYSTADLVGKTIGVPNGIGDSDQNITYRFLNHDGIDPTDVNYKVVEVSACILAMQNGEIQAATLPDQFAKPFLDDGTLRIIRSLTFDEDFRQETCCIHAINTDFLKANPITSKKLTIAFRKASQWMLDNPEEAVKLLQDNQWASGEYDKVVEIFRTYNFGVSDAATAQTLRDVLDDYKSFGLISNTRSTDEILDDIWVEILAN